MCILRVNEKVFLLLGWSGLQKFTCKLPSSNNCGAHFPVGKIIYWVGSLGAMGRLNLLGGQNNLQGGHMPTQLTCYLPSCFATLKPEIVFNFNQIKRII